MQTRHARCCSGPPQRIHPPSAWQTVVAGYFIPSGAWNEAGLQLCLSGDRSGLPLVPYGLYLKFQCDFQVSSPDKSQTLNLFLMKLPKSSMSLSDFLVSLLCTAPEFLQSPNREHAEGLPNLHQTPLIFLFPSNCSGKYKSPNSVCTGNWEMPPI